MKIRAEQKNCRQTPRKVNLVAAQVRGLSLTQAFEQLALINKKASIVLLKVMRQAVANAMNNHGLGIDQLEIDQILVKTGPTYKRFRAVSRGRAHRILKRTCHVEVILKSKQESKKAVKKTEKKVEQKKEEKPAKKAEKKKATEKAKKAEKVSASKKNKNTKKTAKKTKNTKESKKDKKENKNKKKKES